MGVARLKFLAIFLLVGAVGCGKKSLIPFDDSVPSDQKSYLRDDMNRLSDLNLSTMKGDDSTITGMTDFSGEALSNWLKARVKFIVGEEFDKTARATKTAYDGSISPAIVANLNAELDRTVVVMSNLGGGLYRDGIEKNVIYSVEIKGEMIRVNSPRVGIIKIGEGLFMSGKTTVDTASGSLYRLATLFHEARHSDGNGTNRAFPHEKCPSGDFAGEYACDGATNGPYALEAVLVRLFTESCSDCNSTDRSALALIQSDTESRKLPSATHKDERPEALP